MELTNLTVSELSEKLKKKEVSSKELTSLYLRRMEEVDEKIHAYITVCRDSAVKEAEAADKRIKEGDATPLTGVPIAIKDIFCTKDVRTTCASRILENFVPPYDATVVRKLKEAGAVILGKLNMDEFAMGSYTENSAFFPTLNPWDTKRVPGGSSGGSAAAVAAGECAASIGTDTGGSIRQPASLCGVTGLKPTYGRVSRFGMIAFASSLDQGGPITKDVTDCAIMLKIIAGHDPLDSTSMDAPVPDYMAALKKEIKNMRIGIPKEYFIEGLDKDVSEAIKDAIGVFKKAGAELVDITLPHTE
ncbi:MAG TPA: amidase, partial [Thermodesulfobacteriota bacterium]|nr:amidase [Thermodesulfobacteriota bacterium]